MSKHTTVTSLPVNMYEANEQITVAIPMPGAHHDTVSVNLEGRRLALDADPRYPQEQQHYLRHEWSVGASHHEIDLPKPVRADGAKAILTHGILTISLPIAREDTNSRTAIPVAEPPIHQGQEH
jgi:HSP20 family molecular chaperone IbpA